MLAGTVPLLEALVPTNQEGLFFLASETLANPVEVLSSRRCTEVINEMREHFDMVIFDTPPLASFIEAAVLAAKVDGTILVLSPGFSDRNTAAEAFNQLKKANAKVLGVVFNNVTDSYISNYFYHRRKDKSPSNKRIFGVRSKGRN